MNARGTIAFLTGAGVTFAFALLGSGRLSAQGKPPASGHTHGHTAATASPAALPAEYDARLVALLIDAANGEGDAQRGAQVFREARFACLSCHQVGAQGGAVGPALNDVGKRLKPAEIAEAVLWPRRTVKAEYVAWSLVLANGQTRQGYKLAESNEAIELFDPTTQRSASIPKSEIDEQHETGTLMPDGIAAAMSAAQRRDLLRFLLELGRTPGLEDAIGAPHVPATFAYDRAPLDPAAWPLWQHPVNDERLYDFYLKEALYFRAEKNRPHLLPAFPGLDGGAFGHWGKDQGEKRWMDDRWSASNFGSMQAGVFHGAGDLAVPKGICVRLGDKGELACCFNPETLTYDALWSGGFLTLSPIRHGFMDGLRPGGTLLPRPEGVRPDEPFIFRGLYRYGPRVVFAYRIGNTDLLDAPWVRDGKFERVVSPADSHPLRAALQGGPRQWPQELTTVGELGPDRPYTIDTIRLPFDNPWKALLFASDHDFLPDGTAFVATMAGDVWRVTGLDESLKEVRWRRFATGLNQPLGVTVFKGQVYTLGRDQLTRLHDLNGDGEADFYECVSNAYTTSPAGHDFICGAAHDDQGRFITASGNQGLIRITPGRADVEVLATGLRNPDGVCRLPDGAITAPCSEGEWTPASMICLVKPNQRPAPHFGYGGPVDGIPPALPMVYLPRGIDNSSGGQAVVTDPRFGPLANQIMHLSFGQSSHVLVLRDEVDGQPQGAVVPLAGGEFRSGVHRAKANPRDGQLYVSGLTGWVNFSPDDGCFHRVRYTKKRVQLPQSLHLHENGVRLTFVEPVDRGVSSKPENHFAQVWNYRYGPGYGSADLAPSHPGVVGHEVLEITGAQVIDERTLFIEMPQLQPVNQLHLVVQIEPGRPQELFITAHKLDRPFTQFPGYQSATKIIAAHPQSVDLAALGKSIPNPWRYPTSPDTPARLELQAEKNLTYSTRRLKAKASAFIELTFTNPDVVPHNWVLVRPGSLAKVGDLANKLIADPEAVLRQYVPQTDDVLVYTDIVPARQSFTIYFQAPAEKGVYPYLCTFPGHWMVMNGELVVE
ncbi:MAG: DUF6797 domain-containing protein [Planctomycetaceae bacterium]